jgi:hypothetical protein
MPSIAEVADEFKGILGDIKNGIDGTQNNTSTLIGQIGQLHTTTQSGFSNLSQALGILIRLQAQNNELLAGNNQQNETIICWLTHIAHVLCDVKHNTDAEVKLQVQLAATLTHLDDLLELVHASEAMNLLRRNELEERIARCCDRPPPEPQPCFRDCNLPRLPDYRPLPIDWEPIRFDRPGK